VFASWPSLLPRLRYIRRFGSAQSGVAAVEFAFLMPVLIMFVIGTYAIGLTMHRISSVGYALEETARALQLNPNMTDTQLQSTINQNLAPLGKESVSLTKSVTKDASNADVAILTLSYSYVVDTPFVPVYSGTYTRTANVFLNIPD